MKEQKIKILISAHRQQLLQTNSCSVGLFSEAWTTEKEEGNLKEFEIWISRSRITKILDDSTSLGMKR